MLHNYGTLRFEAPEGAAPVGGGGEPESTPEWTGVSQEQWQSVEQGLGRMGEFFEWLDNQPDPQAQPEPEPQRFQIDPLSDNFQEQLDQYIESRLQPHNEFIEQQTLTEGEQRAMDVLHDISTREGEFLLEDSMTEARHRAEAFLPENQAKYGYGPKAAEASLEQAFKHQMEYEKRVGEAYHKRKMNEMSNLTEQGRRRDLPAAGSQGARVVNVPEGGNEMDLVRAYHPPAAR